MRYLYRELDRSKRVNRTSGKFEIFFREEQRTDETNAFYGFRSQTDATEVFVITASFDYNAFTSLTS